MHKNVPISTGSLVVPVHVHKEDRWLLNWQKDLMESFIWLV